MLLVSIQSLEYLPIFSSNSTQDPLRFVYATDRPHPTRERGKNVNNCKLPLFELQISPLPSRCASTWDPASQVGSEKTVSTSLSVVEAFSSSPNEQVTNLREQYARCFCSGN